MWIWCGWIQCGYNAHSVINVQCGQCGQERREPQCGYAAHGVIQVGMEIILAGGEVDNSDFSLQFGSTFHILC